MEPNPNWRDGCPPEITSGAGNVILILNGFGQSPLGSGVNLDGTYKRCDSTEGWDHSQKKCDSDQDRCGKDNVPVYCNMAVHKNNKGEEIKIRMQYQTNIVGQSFWVQEEVKQVPPKKSLLIPIAGEMIGGHWGKLPWQTPGTHKDIGNLWNNDKLDKLRAASGMMIPIPDAAITCFCLGLSKSAQGCKNPTQS